MDVIGRKVHRALPQTIVVISRYMRSVSWIGYRLLKIPMSLLIGLLAGLQTQPAVLRFALEQTNNDLPNLGYAACSHSQSS